MQSFRRPMPDLGFSLIEMAIVLVIIGLLLSGILKGQELIDSTKAKALGNDFRTIPLLLYSYQDKFRAIPGDDPGARAHLGATAGLLTPTPETLGNGRIEGLYNSSAATDESLAFWQHIRLANLASGPIDFSTATALPRNTQGGRLGIQSATPIVGMTGAFFACSDAIPGKLAKQIDIALDDGATDNGSVRTMTTGYNGAEKRGEPTESIANETPYTVCAAF
ncbi:type II secretion system protein [Propionivibrio dicarboxylicus]|uniref:Prepilin-type N-terminal cleavage/methylation domain-containing protein n=1 Tax=Propionivibrio dicarboxylicus TaxID=83767 RepID=A0A1G8L201_9RHOO|nr:prepilin-type N-terminal cleavage/methylation domain-containing protein [Propionivibrio dicarboxylicus]SDI49641.1 prepilin-type N-terminal cleavage/methylation domain-containing protein [Propionivibrio dicarboxylicus]